MLFNTTLKSHYLCHLADDAREFHPAMGWAFGGESFLAHIKKHVQKNAAGTRSDMVGNKVIDCWASSMHHHFSENPSLRAL